MLKPIGCANCSHGVVYDLAQWADASPAIGRVEHRACHDAIIAMRQLQLQKSVREHAAVVPARRALKHDVGWDTTTSDLHPRHLDVRARLVPPCLGLSAPLGVLRFGGPGVSAIFTSVLCIAFNAHFRSAPPSPIQVA